MWCEVNKFSRFDRKTYFYPDNPTAYQITQLYTPIVENGRLEIDLENGDKKTIRVNRAHIEADAGKNIHDGDIVIIERRSTAENGESVVVRINDEMVTMKKSRAAETNQK